MAVINIAISEQHINMIISYNIHEGLMWRMK